MHTIFDGRTGARRSADDHAISIEPRRAPSNGEPSKRRARPPFSGLFSSSANQPLSPFFSSTATRMLATLAAQDAVEKSSALPHNLGAKKRVRKSEGERK